MSFCSVFLTETGTTEIYPYGHALSRHDALPILLPARRSVPLLVSGPHAPVGAAILHDLGFSHVAQSGPQVGDASAIKMIRSIMIKGDRKSTRLNSSN